MPRASRFSDINTHTIHTSPLILTPVFLWPPLPHTQARARSLATTDRVAAARWPLPFVLRLTFRARTRDRDRSKSQSHTWPQPLLG